MAESTTTEQRTTGEQRPDLDLTRAQWQPSGQAVGDVQIAFVDGFIAMRDRRSPDGPAVVFSPGEWRGFMLRARDGEFDLT
ncbi:DUF397 domain-containing protein [Streptomyces sp. Ru73]|uniref:DUF397 domain-containing protein n=1 Tax=Streptomyces sp. Ru73 TaxID=2080748 RepID=UPI000CDD5B92|nr:DUF397 domain-containing protein [Streptomyces sp. Ru73]POX43512.1 DUF397 domain-containing protein [Streptomyces sp. Ru73]